MKTYSALKIPVIGVILVCFGTISTHAGHPDTADYYLSFAERYLNTEIDLDVNFVKPVHWVSPDPEIAFFRAATYDKKEKRMGGAILVILPSTAKEKFVKKYELNPERRDSDRMEGVLRTLPARKHPRGKVYILDYEGLSWETLQERVKKLSLDEETGEDLAVGGGNMRRGPGMRPGKANR
jgi:hypothetical protein